MKETAQENTSLGVEIEGSIARITLNRPEVHNAFDGRLIAELTDCYVRLGTEASIRVIVLAGAGTSFCAGADLGWMRRMADYTEEENRADARKLQQMFTEIARCPKVTIARVQGAAIGGGAGLVAVCDIAISVPEAIFALSEVRLGLVPAVIAPYILEKIGAGAARALFVTGERFGAGTALRLGLVQHIVPAAELEMAVQQKADLACQAGPEAVAEAKRLLTAIVGQTPDETASATVACIAALRVSPEGQEGMRAFFEKRKPNWNK